MRYLLDTCAVSELSQRTPNEGVIRFLLALPVEDSFLSAITVGEIQRVIIRLPEGKKRQHLFPDCRERHAAWYACGYAYLKDFEPTGVLIVNPWEAAG